MKRYDVIYADCPWKYKDKANAGKRGADHKYSTLDINELYSLPIHKIAKENCALFLWATFPLMDQAIELIKEWDFKYKTFAFVWIKKNPKSGTNFIGMGNWTRANAEVVLLGVRGSIKRKSASVRQVIEHPILKPHSRKPAIVRDRIVELMGEGLNMIELFCTEHPEGWDYTGLNSTGEDIRDFLNVNKKKDCCFII